MERELEGCRNALESVRAYAKKVEDSKSESWGWGNSDYVYMRRFINIILDTVDWKVSGGHFLLFFLLRMLYSLGKSSFISTDGEWFLNFTLSVRGKAWNYKQ